MSLEPLGGISASAAGTSGAQSAGAPSDVSRAESAIRARRLAAGTSAADGISASDGANLQTNDRDADGRPPWEAAPQDNAHPPDDAAHPPRPADHRGRSLDLTG